MTVWSTSATIVNNPPGTLTLNTPVGPAGSIILVRISNTTPFAFTLNGVFDQSGSSPILQAFTQNLYPYTYIRGNITLTAGIQVPGLVVQPNMIITAE